MKTIPQPINNLNIKTKKCILKLVAFFSIFLQMQRCQLSHQLDQNIGDLAINRSISYIFKKVIIANKVF